MNMLLRCSEGSQTFQYRRWILKWRGILRISAIMEPEVLGNNSANDDYALRYKEGRHQDPTPHGFRSFLEFSVKLPAASASSSR